ncbi:MAG: hypothetical protein EOO29_01790 [Comamonadaceae bacterium]|nr:MAG: hypothetical protein EOO29_01790 [Comamonadaceae bacterium]
MSAPTVMWIKQLLAAALWLALATAALASPLPALVSILDGDAVLLRDSGRFALAEGVRLGSGDLIETDAKARLLRLEFADGSLVDLGPGTRVLVAPRLGTRATAAAPQLYVLQGWFKLSTPATSGQAPALPPLVFTPAQALTLPSGQQVVSVEAAGVQAFCEAGGVTLQSRAAKAATSVKLKAGEYFAQSPQAGATDKAVVTPRPPSAFIQAVPRSFLDPLPLRAALFKGRDVVPKRLADLAYDDVSDWLSAEPALRSYFVGQWRALARRPDFRAALAARMRSHPEWDRIVFPEKYLPKPAAPAPVAKPPMARH